MVEELDSIVHMVLASKASKTGDGSQYVAGLEFLRRGSERLWSKAVKVKSKLQQRDLEWSIQDDRTMLCYQDR